MEGSDKNERGRRGGYQAGKIDGRRDGEVVSRGWARMFEHHAKGVIWRWSKNYLA